MDIVDQVLDEISGQATIDFPQTMKAASPSLKGRTILSSKTKPRTSAPRIAKREAKSLAQTVAPAPLALQTRAIRHAQPTGLAPASLIPALPEQPAKVRTKPTLGAPAATIAQADSVMKSIRRSPTQKEDGEGHMRLGTQSAHALAVFPFTDDPTINEIAQGWRLRQRWHRAEKSLVLQGKALCRAWTGGDKIQASKLFDACREAAIDDSKPNDGAPPPELQMALLPFTEAIDRFQERRAAVEKGLKKSARSLPIWEWAESIKGFGEQSLASIVGEAGDIGTYKSVSALWKRFGLAVIGGERQRQKSDADAALAHGYNPARRSVMWNVGGALIGGMNHGPRPLVGEDVSTREDLTIYQKLFIERCRYEVARDETMRRPDTAAGKESYSTHASNRAKRYVEKRFLRDLYAAWSG
jgi:hypothetical protein